LSPQVGIKAYRFKNPPLPSPDAPLKQKRQGSDRNPKNPKPSTADRVDSIFSFYGFWSVSDFTIRILSLRKKVSDQSFTASFEICSRNVPPDGENF
jgi:hypothetical protein